MGKTCHRCTYLRYFSFPNGTDDVFHQISGNLSPTLLKRVVRNLRPCRWCAHWLALQGSDFGDECTSVKCNSRTNASHDHCNSAGYRWPLRCWFEHTRARCSTHRIQRRVVPCDHKGRVLRVDIHVLWHAAIVWIDAFVTILVGGRYPDSAKPGQICHSSLAAGD